MAHFSSRNPRVQAEDCLKWRGPLGFPREWVGTGPSPELRPHSCHLSVLPSSLHGPSTVPAPGLSTRPGQLGRHWGTAQEGWAPTGANKKDVTMRSMRWGGCLLSDSPGPQSPLTLSSSQRRWPLSPLGWLSHHCRLPPAVFGNGRTHTGEVMGSGGSRLANYGARPPQAALQPAAAAGTTPPALGLLPPREGGRDSGPQVPGSGRGWVQLEVTLTVSLHPPEVTGLRASWEAVLRLGGGWVLPRGLEIQPRGRESGWVAELRKEGTFGVRYPHPAFLFRVGPEASGEGLFPFHTSLAVGLPRLLAGRIQPGIHGHLCSLAEAVEGWMRQRPQRCDLGCV